MKGDIHIDIIGHLAQMTIEDLVKLLNAAGVTVKDFEKAVRAKKKNVGRKA